MLDARIPSGPIEQKWEKCRFDMKLVNPANRRKHYDHRGGLGSGGRRSGGLSWSARLSTSNAFPFTTRPRRAHSIAAQGGINAAKNYRNDGDSVFRLFYDTVKGGDFRSREGNVYRLAQISVNIIDQCVAQGVPFAREYGGLARYPIVRRRAGPANFLRSRQTGQQLLLGAYQALEEQVAAGTRDDAHRATRCSMS